MILIAEDDRAIRELLVQRSNSVPTTTSPSNSHREKSWRAIVRSYAAEEPMVRTRRTFRKELKLSILRELEAAISLAELAREHEIHPETIRAVEETRTQIWRARLCRQWQIVHR